ncbi:hypothetical protein TNCT_122341 [Trichonephila clavata]|uniref:Uncharacterized protein n=1 Tax=Trichonephila clavata TaxID=2740835 RepID=A0A8X6HRK3_TRICU|nr:hypothetical protein TNCT_122341 [Trichonephila clavata]
MASDANESGSKSEINQIKNDSYSSMQVDIIGKKSGPEIVINYAWSNEGGIIHSSVYLNYADIESTLTQFKAESHDNIIHWRNSLKISLSYLIYQKYKSLYLLKGH